MTRPAIQPIAATAAALLLGALLTPYEAEAQRPPPPNPWASVWLGGFIDPDRVVDFQSGTIWRFGSAFAAGAGAHWRIDPTLTIGTDISYARLPVEFVDTAGQQVIGDGDASVVALLLSGRFRYRGGGAVSFYLSGGAGTLIYGMPEPVDRWDPDLALFTGAGLEYSGWTRRALFVEWGRYWTFHQREGIEDNTAHHSLIRIGARHGF